jgi:hypothetical protein
MSVTHEKKVAVHPEDGDTLKWPVEVHFLNRSPCKDDAPGPGHDTKECEVVVKAGTQYGHYRYRCDMCTDPEIVVGTDDGKDFPLLKALSNAEPTYIEISCDGSSLTPYPMNPEVPANTTIRCCRWCPTRS